MSKLTFKNSFVVAAFGAILATAGAIACNRGGQTDGGPGQDDAGPGTLFVSDGGAGAEIEIEAPDRIDVGDIEGFRVRLKDPRGEPLAFIRIFCESEKGIAIIEPAKNGVAFEHTAANGEMSGRVGGLAPGSYLFECRASEGFNLVDRVTIVIDGPIPDNFQGFEGAAGGNLGGGIVVEDPVVDPDEPLGSEIGITSITFDTTGGGGGQVGNIDRVFNGDCDGDPLTDDPEPFGPDRLTITIDNPENEDLVIETIRFVVNDGTGATSIVEGNGLRIDAGSSDDVSVLLTDLVGTATKRWAGSGIDIIEASSTITVTVTVTRVQSGDGATLTDTATYTADGFDNC